ncbi:ABC transporter ATP-binding protein [uncultured Clostridium sp.]|mgnify:CR=1 FL=1|uniref:ABC transporter ATP-binding protein n=1 Tax=uncultured Clostridium sp. TaxID=59620 RepID=UPI0025D6CF24|nr:ABC transporter ATP-binding protein [uncultured Clostridium sp.]
MAKNKYDVDEVLTKEFHKGHLKELLKYILPYKKSLFISLFLMLICSFMGLICPYLSKLAIDTAIPNKDIKYLFILSAIFLVAMIVLRFCIKYRILYMENFGQTILTDLRKDLFTHLQSLSPNYYDSRPDGKILIRVVNYINSLSNLLTNGLIDLICNIVTLIISIGFMFYLDLKLTLIALISVPLVVIILTIIKTFQRPLTQKLSIKDSNFVAFITEQVNGLKVIKAFVTQNRNINIFNKLSIDVVDISLKSAKLNFLVWPSVENISVFIVSTIYIVDAIYFDCSIKLGVLSAFITYFWSFWSPIMNIGNFYNSFVIAMSQIERIFEVFDEKPLIYDTENSKDIDITKGSVEFRNVNFSYEEDTPLIKNMNFFVNPHETIALVGPTGAGKTTITNLISRFYDVQSGEVLLDGVNIKNFKISSLRKQLGVMLQDTTIFSGTVMDNIRYGNLEASDDDIIKICKLMNIHDFITELKDGYDTKIKEGGSELSLGQKQLISLARTLIANPKILILDEATSNIDTKTETLLQQGLQPLLQNRTTFIIAHRLSTIKEASRIMYISNGDIIEFGTHEELMDKHGEYYTLYTSQNMKLQYS